MISRWNRWGPLGGLLLCIAWSPMAIAIPGCPISTPRAMCKRSGARIKELMQGVILSVSVGFLFLLVFLGALAELVRTVSGSRCHAWIVLASALMFMTALNVALGLDIAGGCSSLESIRQAHMRLHTGGVFARSPRRVRRRNVLRRHCGIHLGVKGSAAVVGMGRRYRRDRQRWGGRWVPSLLTGPLELWQRDRGRHCRAARPVPTIGSSASAAWWLRRGPSLDAVSSGGTPDLVEQSAPAGRA